MRLAFVGDVHGRVLHLLAALRSLQRSGLADFDAVVQVGDFGALPTEAELPWIGVDSHERSAREFLDVLARPAGDPLLAGVRGTMGQPVRFARGNHDNRHWLHSLARHPLPGGGGHAAPVDQHGLFEYLPDGAVSTLAGLRVAVLGGVEHPDPASSPTPGSELIDDDAFAVLWSLGPGAVDVLVTHEPPAGAVIDGSTRLAMLARRLRPGLHVGGHVHVPIGPTTTNGTTYLGLGTLLRSPRFDPSRTVQPGCVAVLDTDSGSVTHIGHGPLAAITAATVPSFLA